MAILETIGALSAIAAIMVASYRLKRQLRRAYSA